MRSLLLLTALLVFTSLLPLPAQAAVSPYVRTANYFLLSGTTLDDPEIRATIKQYDLLVLAPQAQLYNKDFFEEIREENPDVIILAYVPTVSYNGIWEASLYDSLKAGILSSWWLRDASGEQVSIWPNTEALNLTSGWNTYLADWTIEEVMDTGYWDGIFYNEVSAEIDFVDDVDLDRDGEADRASTANNAWTDGLVTLLSRTRSRVDPEDIIVINGSSNLELMPYVNGRLFESFPTPWEGSGTWTELTQRYLDLEEEVGYDPIFIINSNSNNTGNATNYQQIRFHLTTTLLGDGYFSYDYGTSSHEQTWYYDEYDIALGEPVEEPKDLLDPENETISQSVWERDYENGKAILNSTSSSQRVRLDGDYEKIHGTQDATVNDGSIVSSVTLAANDGLLLLRPLQDIFDAVFTNGAFVRIFDKTGATKRTGFFSYTTQASGNEQVVRYDTDNDGARETIVAGKSRVDIYEANGSLRVSFYPYTASYQQGVNISVGDLESDGTVEIVTGTEDGGGPQIRIFNANGVLIHPGFFAYDTAFRGGVNVAIGDLNNDGWYEIIAGAGVGGGPHVRVFNKDGKVINPGFFAYDPSFRGGVNVAVGDLDGDHDDEIITGPGEGGGPQIRVFSKEGLLLNPGFFAYDESGRNGVEVSAGDLDGDGRDEIIGIGSDVFTLSLF